MHELIVKSGATTEVPLTRQALAREGVALAASLEPGDFVGVEVDSVQEPYLIGEVVQPLTVWSGPEERTFMGRMTEGDQVVQVRRFMGAATRECADADSVYWHPCFCGGYPRRQIIGEALRDSCL